MPDLRHFILAALDEDQALDVSAIALAGKSDLADHMIVASGRSSRHIAAMAGKLAQRLKEKYGIRARLEGLTAADWVLLDAGDVIVHIFHPEVRAFYNLEKMWMLEVTPHGAASR